MCRVHIKFLIKHKGTIVSTSIWNCRTILLVVLLLLQSSDYFTTIHFPFWHLSIQQLFMIHFNCLFPLAINLFSCNLCCCVLSIYYFGLLNLNKISINRNIFTIKSFSLTLFCFYHSNFHSMNLKNFLTLNSTTFFLFSLFFIIMFTNCNLRNLNVLLF